MDDDFKYGDILVIANYEIANINHLTRARHIFTIYFLSICSLLYKSFTQCLPFRFQSFGFPTTFSTIFSISIVESIVQTIYFETSFSHKQETCPSPLN